MIKTPTILHNRSVGIRWISQNKAECPCRARVDRYMSRTRADSRSWPHWRDQ